ncbi:hypothetical protein B0H12DRAFT_1291764 [Mycena haematopus]|nr:hypothetical protein B0H12DRAFT_1291764 [Mycena haematopus]
MRQGVSRWLTALQGENPFKDIQFSMYHYEKWTKRCTSMAWFCSYPYLMEWTRNKCLPKKELSNHDYAVCRLLREHPSLQRISSYLRVTLGIFLSMRTGNIPFCPIRVSTAMKEHDNRVQTRLAKWLFVRERTKFGQFGPQTQVPDGQKWGVKAEHARSLSGQNTTDHGLWQWKKEPTDLGGSNFNPVVLGSEKVNGIHVPGQYPGLKNPYPAPWAKKWILARLGPVRTKLGPTLTKRVRTRMGRSADVGT